jgi:hypothetical protein
MNIGPWSCALVCVCVCERERERERESSYRERERERALTEREREREKQRERERERDCLSHSHPLHSLSQFFYNILTLFFNLFIILGPAAFIGAGLLAIEKFRGVLVGFAALLIYSSYKILTGTGDDDDEEQDLSENEVLFLDNEFSNRMCSLYNVFSIECVLSLDNVFSVLYRSVECVFCSLPVECVL